MLGFLRRNNPKPWAPCSLQLRGHWHLQWLREKDTCLCLPDLRRQRPSLHWSPLPAPPGMPSLTAQSHSAVPRLSSHAAPPPPRRLCVGTSERFPHPIGLNGTAHRGARRRKRAAGAGLVAPGDGSARACSCAGVSEVGGGVGAALSVQTGPARGPSGAFRSRRRERVCVDSRVAAEFLWPGSRGAQPCPLGFRGSPSPRPTPGHGTLQPSRSLLPPSRFSSSVPLIKSPLMNPNNEIARSPPASAHCTLVPGVLSQSGLTLAPEILVALSYLQNKTQIP